MSQYFPKPYEPFGGDINVKVDLSNYATKTNIKNISHVDTPSFALKANLANLKTEVDKLDIDKLVPVPVDLSKLSDVVKNDVVKKDVYNKLVTKVNNIDSSGFVLKTKYDTDKSELENKIPDTSGLVKKTDYNTKITEIEGKIPDISNLATKTALATVENKIPSVSNLVKKTDYNTKFTEIESKLNNHNHDKCIDTSEFNKLAVDVFNARIAQANLITKTDFDAFELWNLNKTITQNKTKHLLVENELNKLKTFDFGYFNGKSHFEEDGTQNYLIFQPIYRYFKAFSITQYLEYVSEWKSKGLSSESFKAFSTFDNGLNPTLNYYGTKMRVKFTGDCLEQQKITYTHGKVVNIYIIYSLGSSGFNYSNPTIKNCLFGRVTLTKNADIDKYRYSGYGIGFERRGRLSFPGGGFGQNVIIFGADMSSSTHIDNKGKDILILGVGPTQGLGEHPLTAGKMYSINFTVTNVHFCFLSLHYNGANSYLFVNGTEIYKFKAKDSEIVASPLCLGNISKDWSTDNMKKKQVLMDMFMILVLIMMLLQLMILKTFINI